MTDFRRLSPAAARGRVRVCFSLLAVAAVMAPLLGGCGSKPKPSAPGYYTGPMEKKSGTTSKPAAGAPQ